jgi:2-deoxy-D-gluconate 3-dehydrogenase
MRDLFDLSGKVAIVTGGNGGIGLGMARGLASRGAKIVVAARNAAKSKTAVADLQGLGAEAVALAVDVVDTKSVLALIADAKARFGRIDILINNSGINIRKAPDMMSLDEWRKVLDVNLTGAFACSNAVYPELVRAGGGKIVNIGSMMSIFGASFAPAYAASKGGIVQYTKACAAAWAKDNIQVNAVLPGWIDTELTRGAREQVPGLHERVLARVMAGRWGVPDDLAGIAAFLCSRASDYLTGTAIPVDGGYSAMG